jgi:preprotein translocase subunit SecF
MAIQDFLQDTNYDFVGKRRVLGFISIVVVATAWALFFTVGPNWGIDFTGGTELHLAFEEEVTIDELRTSLRSIGLDDDSVQQVGGRKNSEYKIRVQDATFGAESLQVEVEARLAAEFGEEWIDPERTYFDAEVGARMAVGYNGDEVSMSSVKAVFADMDRVVVQRGREEQEVVIQLPGLSAQIVDSIRDAMGEQTFEVLATDSVGPKVGGDLRRQGFISIMATLALVLLYIAFRFDLSFAPGAIIALIHDVSITVGIFVVLGHLFPDRFVFNLPIIGALLTIVGYSLNDTIVIYDRIRENRDRYRRHDTVELINTSVNETLARTIATSVTTLFAMTAFLIYGGNVIQDFASAMMCGIVFGTYSTVFVASPMILVMEDLQPYLRKLVAAPEYENDEEAEAASVAAMTQSQQRRVERQKLADDPAE